MLLLFSAVLAENARSAQPSDYDFSFGVGGKAISPRLGSGKTGTVFRDLPTSLAIDSQARIVVGGSCEVTGIFCVVRYLPNGTPDEAFGVSGLTSLVDGTPTTPRAYFGATVKGISISAGDKIAVAGLCQSAITSLNVICVTQFSPDGSTNKAFGNSGLVTVSPSGSWGRDSVEAITVQTDEKLVVAALCPQADGPRLCLLRFLKNGQPDVAFGQSGVSTTILGTTVLSVTFSSVQIQSDGKLRVAGNCQRLTGVASFCVFRYAANGDTDKTFGANGVLHTDIGGYGDAKAPQMTTLEDGRFILSGICDRGFCVARYDSDGRRDVTFGRQGLSIIAGTYTTGASPCGSQRAGTSCS